MVLSGEIMPVLYQPKFCCNCGEKIDRVDWRPWTSRRFCDVCETEQKHYDLLPRVLVGVGLVAGLWGIAVYMQAPPQVAPKNSPPSSARKIAVPAGREEKAPEVFANAAVQKTPAPARAVPSNSSAPAPGFSAAEAVYFCGAMTKKGTACSRRVKMPGRCWQHQGQPGAAEMSRSRSG